MSPTLLVKPYFIEQFDWHY